MESLEASAWREMGGWNQSDVFLLHMYKHIKPPFNFSTREGGEGCKFHLIPLFSLISFSLPGNLRRFRSLSSTIYGGA